MTGPNKDKADAMRKEQALYAEATLAPWFDEKPVIEVPMAIAQKLPVQIQFYLPDEQKQALQVGGCQPTVAPNLPLTSLTSCP